MLPHVDQSYVFNYLSVIKLYTFSVNDYDRCCHLATSAAFSSVQCFNCVSMLVTFNYMGMK